MSKEVDLAKEREKKYYKDLMRNVKKRYRQWLDNYILYLIENKEVSIPEGMTREDAIVIAKQCLSSYLTEISVAKQFIKQ